MNRPELEVADVFRAHGDEFLARGGVSFDQARVLRDLAACRTAALGGYVLECTECGNQEIAYLSCRNRHCPKCQASNRREWVETQKRDLLPVQYFHVVFTVPQEIAALALQNKCTVYQDLLRASANTLLQIAADPKHLGAGIGFLSVLHTWGQNVLHHPHVHSIVPGGGLSPDGSRWISSPQGFFLPVRVLSRVFRAKFLERLQKAYDKGELTFHGRLQHLNDPTTFCSYLAATYKNDWVVYSKPPFGGPEQVLKYLARYTHRVAISNHRLLSLEDGKVTFSWRDYANGNRRRVMTLDALEFIRRFLLHVLPKAFVRVRHYGFLANRVREAKLQLCRELLEVVPPSDFPIDLFGMETAPAPDSTESEEQCPRCPVCGRGTMVPVCALLPGEEEVPQRSPPRRAAA